MAKNTRNNTSIYSSTSSVVTVGAGGGGNSNSSYSGTIVLPATSASSGLYATTSGWTSISQPQNATVKITGKNPTIQTENSEINIDELIGIVKTLKEVLNVIPKNERLLNENPTLRDSYAHYESVLKEKLSDPALVEAYNQYRTLEILSTEEQKE